MNFDLAIQAEHGGAGMVSHGTFQNMDKEMDIENIRKELEELVQETFTLWDHNRVGFQWRHYTWNHTLRVRAMCLKLGEREDADLSKLTIAALLHDITKRYDGSILTDGNGNRRTDEFGFWQNETLHPARENTVTRYYDAADLYGKIHSFTGACVARRLLADYGLLEDFIEDVAAIIEAHVKPVKLSPQQLAQLYEPMENQIISDADTMDANVGYVAFYRNIHIHSFSRIQRQGAFDVRDYVPSVTRWIDMKQPFADGLFTESAREIANERQERKRELARQLELESNGYFTMNRKYGLLGMIEFFVSGYEDPHMFTQLEQLKERWIPTRQAWIEDEKGSAQRDDASEALGRVENFVGLLECEIQAQL